MRIAIGVTGLLCIIAIGVLLWLRFGKSPAVATVSTPEQVYGWAKVESGAFEAGSMLAQLRPLNEKLTGKVRIEISSTSPIIFGLASSQDRNNLLNLDSEHPSLVTDAIRRLKCARTDSFQSQVDCECQGEDSLYVLDSRSPLSILATAIGALKLGAGAAKDFTSNKVTFDLYEWRCIENCSSTATDGSRP